MVVQILQRRFRLFLRRVLREGETAVVAVEVHHQTQLVDSVRKRGTNDRGGINYDKLRLLLLRG